MSALSQTGQFCRSFRGVKLSLWSKPARDETRGGDWCEAFPVSESSLAVSVGDVCGHGTSAYGEMVALRDAIRRAIHKQHDLTEILAEANRIALRSESAAPVSAIVALFHAPSRMLLMVNAGHPRPLLQTSAGSAPIGTTPGALPLGVVLDRPCWVESVWIPAASLLVFYTDGLIERDRNAIKGERDLALAVAHVFRFPYLNAAHAIANELTFGDCSFEDDAAVLTLRTI